jgi:broad specificity phosphatase PhoE
MPPTLVLVRHAEALHNMTNDHTLRDPELSSLGLQQCAALRDKLKKAFPKIGEVGLIVASPMRRTLQTASIALDWLISEGVKVEVDADWQEIHDKPCDTGTPLPELKLEFPAFDLSVVDPVYPDKTSPEGRRYADTRSAVLARAQAALSKLYRRPENLIIVVSHSGFMRLAVSGTYFANADYRIFDFSERKSKGDPYSLDERESTRSNGGGMGLSPKGQVELGLGYLPTNAGSARLER